MGLNETPPLNNYEGLPLDLEDNINDILSRNGNATKPCLALIEGSTATERVTIIGADILFLINCVPTSGLQVDRHCVIYMDTISFNAIGNNIIGSFIVRPMTVEESKRTYEAFLKQTKVILGPLYTHDNTH